MAEDFADGQKIVVILGDNLFEKSIKKSVEEFKKQPKGARIFIKEVSQPQRFGVIEFRGKKIISLEEKPKNPKSNFIDTGL